MIAAKAWRALRDFVVEFDTMMQHARHGSPRPRTGDERSKDRKQP